MSYPRIALPFYTRPSTEPSAAITSLVVRSIIQRNVQTAAPMRLRCAKIPFDIGIANVAPKAPPAVMRPPTRPSGIVRNTQRAEIAGASHGWQGQRSERPVPYRRGGAPLLERRAPVAKKIGTLRIEKSLGQLPFEDLAQKTG